VIYQLLCWAPDMSAATAVGLLYGTRDTTAAIAAGAGAGAATGATRTHAASSSSIMLGKGGVGVPRSRPSGTMVREPAPSGPAGSRMVIPGSGAEALGAGVSLPSSFPRPPRPSRPPRPGPGAGATAVMTTMPGSCIPSFPRPLRGSADPPVTVTGVAPWAFGIGASATAAAAAGTPPPAVPAPSSSRTDIGADRAAHAVAVLQAHIVRCRPQVHSEHAHHLTLTRARQSYHRHSHSLKHILVSALSHNLTHATLTRLVGKAGPRLHQSFRGAVVTSSCSLGSQPPTITAFPRSRIWTRARHRCI